MRSLFLWHLCSILFKDGCLHCWRCRSAPFSRGRGKTQPAAEDFQVPATRIWKDRCTEAVLPAPMVPALVVVALRRGRRLGICFTCVKAYQQRHLDANSLLEKVFVSSGFRNWNDATNKFAKHEGSRCHADVVLKLVPIPSSTRDIGELFSSQLARD